MFEEEQITDEYDREFLALIMDIEKRMQKMKKHDKLRLEGWCKKLCQITNNIEWKKNRNLHAICLLNMILNNYYEEPYNKFAPEGPLPILSKTIVKSKLSPKFWKSTQKIYDEITRTNNVKQQYNNEKEYVDEQVQVQDYNTPQQQYNFNEHEMVEVPSKGKRPLSGGKLRAKPNQYNTNEQEYLAQQAPMENDIERLKNTIVRLQNDISQKDIVIQNQKEEKMKLIKRMDELEKMLSSFLVMDKP